MLLGGRPLKSRFHSHHIISTYCQYDFSLLMLTLIIWLLLCKVTPFFSFLYCILWKKVTMCTPHLEWELYPTSLGVESIHKLYEFLLYRKFVLFSIYSILYLCQCGVLFILFFGLSNTTSFIFLLKLFPTLAIGISFSRLLYSFDGFLFTWGVCVCWF